MSELELTAGQKRGLDLALALAATKNALGTICGYAGTGKTTLLREIIGRLRDTVGMPMLLSPTGKAAARIAEVTGFGASTVHRWIYEASQDGNSGLVTFRKKEINTIMKPSCNLVICDEASMVGPDIWNDLQETCQALGCSLLLIGDGFQLPPVMPKGETFSVMGKDFVPEGNWVQLTEILRQAADNPIIRVTMALREGDAYEALADLDVVMPDEIDDALMKADMVICRSNKMRHALNAKVRALRGFKGRLQTGEPLLVLKNNYTLDVYNGETYTYQGDLEGYGSKDVYDFYTHEKAKVKLDLGLVAGKEVILAQEALDGSLDGKVGAHILEKACHYWAERGEGVYLHANFGYVLTAHKSQGSEANRVLVCIEKGMNFTREDDRRWVYTALTRAKERVAIAHIS